MPAVVENYLFADPFSLTDIVSGRSNEIGSSIFVQQVSRCEISAALIDHWRDLERRSCHSNAFLSADFLLPAWALLPRRNDAFLLLVTDRTNGKLLALGAFLDRCATRVFPAPHLQCERTIHTFRTGILVDKEAAEPALEAMLRFMRRRGWHGLEIPKMRLDSNLARHLRTVTAACGYAWHICHQAASPAVFPPILCRDSVEESMSASRRKSLRRNRQWLAEIGPIRLVQITKSVEVVAAVREFLRLEHLGWKGEQQTSMLTSRKETVFLEELALRLLRSGRLVLTQLRVGDRVAASAINFRAGNTLFAFKIAWDPELAKGSPGTIHEYELMFFIQDNFPEITCIDSCARPDSYLATIWPHQIDVGRVIVGMSTVGKLLLRSLDRLRALRRRMPWPKRRKVTPDESQTP